MKRSFASLGLVFVAAGAPAALFAAAGAPHIPAADSFGSISDSYMPLDPVLNVLALLAWTLWLYIVLAITLRVAAVVLAQSTGSDRLLHVTDRIAPSMLRRVVDLAVGGAFLAASLSVVRPSAALPSPPAATAIAAAPTQTDATIRPAPRPKPTYTVRPGDSLWRIAERKLDSGYRWNEIYRLNKGRHFPDGRTLKDPRLIHPGWVLELPASATKPPPETRDTKPSPPAPVASEPPAEPTAVSMERPGESHRDTPPDDLGEDIRDEQAEEPGVGPVIHLPSGAVIATSFACGVLSAELLARLRQRRARRPLRDGDEIEIPERLVRDLRAGGAGPTSTPIEVAIDEVGRAWHAHTGRWPIFLAAVERPDRLEIFLAPSEASLPPSTGGRMSPHLRFEQNEDAIRAEVTGPFPIRLHRVTTPMQRGLLVPLGHTAEDSAVHVAPLGIGVTSVAGQATAQLVRQLLLSASTRSEIEDLQITLLGADPVAGTVPLPHVSREVTWDQSSDALQMLQVEFVRRAHLFQQEGVDDIWEHLAAHPDDQLPAIVVVATEPPPAMRGLIEALFAEAQRFGAAVLAMDWQPAASMHITAAEDLVVRTEIPIPTNLAPFTLDEELLQDATRVVARAVDIQERDDDTIVEKPDQEPTVDAVEVQPVGSPPAAPAFGALPTRVDSPTPEPPPGVPAVFCLGPFSISRDGRIRTKGWLRKSRELVAYLVGHPDGATKERLWDELWPGEEPHRLQWLLDKALSVARMQVRGPDDPKMYFTKVEDAWRLEDGSWWVDALEFTRLVTEAERTAIADATTKLRQAIALYRGNFCDEFPYPWAEPVRERYRSMFTKACARLGEILAGSGENEEALDVLERAIAVDQLCEDLWRRAMLVEKALGRRAAAAERYSRLRHLLATELDVEPDPETDRIARAVTSTEPSRQVEETVKAPHTGLTRVPVPAGPYPGPHEDTAD